MSTPEHVRLAIIGGGPAGFTAALYAGRAGLNPICIEGYESGGQLARSYRVENYPGVRDGITGLELTTRMREQAQGFGARMIFDDVVSVDLLRRPFLITTNETSFTSDALVIATGSKARKLGLASEVVYEARGVAYCAVCDGPFFAGKRVAVVGGGDAAIEEALLLREIASSVTLIHRRDEFRAGVSLQRALRACDDIEVITSSTVDDILGNETGVTGVRLHDVKNGKRTELELDGLFIAIGHEPASAMFAPWIETDQHHRIVQASGGSATNIVGVFAAGDVADSRYRQAITAASSGCQAAIDAERWLLSHNSDVAPQSSDYALAVPSTTPHGG
jgi:thioredoxin reductase (NADPH)